jgi:hypothetical protein
MSIIVGRAWPAGSEKVSAGLPGPKSIATWSGGVSWPDADVSEDEVWLDVRVSGVTF